MPDEKDVPVFKPARWIDDLSELGETQPRIEWHEVRDEVLDVLRQARDELWEYADDGTYDTGRPDPTTQVYHRVRELLAKLTGEEG